MEVVKTADLYLLRHAVVRGRVNSLTLFDVDSLIAHNATSEFLPDADYERVMEALRGINGEATGCHCAMYR